MASDRALVLTRDGLNFMMTEVQRPWLRLVAKASLQIKIFLSCLNREWLIREVCSGLAICDKEILATLLGNETAAEMSFHN